MWAKQSTAATLIVGPILDSAGAEYTSAVIGDLSISKNGGTLTALAAAATLTHIANGQYTLVMTTGNLDTLGRLQITCNKSTYQMPEVRLMVLPATVFDALATNATTAAGGLGDIQRLAGQVITAATGVTFPASIASPTNITAATGVVLAGVTHTGAVIPTVTTLTGHTPQTGDSFARIGATGSGLTSLAPSSTALSTAVWTATIAGRIDVASSTLATASNLAIVAGYLDTEIAAIKTKTDQLTFTTANKVDSTAALDSAAPGQIADAVWDEAMSGHTTNGTYGARVVRATNSNVEVQITDSNHVAADVHEFQAGVITAGDFANNSITAAALAADAVTEIQNGLSTLTASQVNAEVVDALSVDMYAELTAPPAATSSLKDKITWLFMYARNKVTQTASQRKLYRDDGSTVAGTSGTSDDGTTFTKDEDA